jgi:hypothetical protein
MQITDGVGRGGPRAVDKLDRLVCRCSLCHRFLRRQRYTLRRSRAPRRRMMPAKREIICRMVPLCDLSCSRVRVAPDRARYQHIMTAVKAMGTSHPASRTRRHLDAPQYLELPSCHQSSYAVICSPTCNADILLRAMSSSTIGSHDRPARYLASRC